MKGAKHGKQGVVLKTRERLMLALVAMATLPAVVIGVLAYQNATEAIEERVESQLTSISDLKQAEIENWIGLVQADIELLADNFLNEEHITVILDPSTEPELREDFGNFLTQNLESLQASRVGYVEVYYVDRQGRIILSTDEAREGQQVNESLREGIFGRESERFMRDIHEVGDHFEMAFSQVLHEVDFEAMEATEKVIAAVVIRVDVEPNLFSFLLNWPERGETGDSFLVEMSGGNYIHLSPLRFSDAPPLSEALPEHLQSDTTFKPPMTPEQEVVEIQDYRGEQVLHINRPIKGTNWILVVEKDLAEAYGPVVQLRRIWLSVTAITLLAAFVVAAVVAQGLTNPLNTLTEATRRVGRGDLDTKVHMERDDEFGELADAFNKMVGSLSENAERIQHRSEELQALVNLSDTFLASVDVGVGLESALHETLAATRAEAAVAVLLNEEEDRFRTEAEVNLSGDLLGATYRVDRLTAAGYCILERRAIVSRDLGLEARFRSAPTVRSMGVQSLMAVPLLIGLRVIGAMVFYGFQAHEFEEEEIKLAQTIANQTAVALERIKLVEDLSVSYDRTLSALVAALDARDKETEGHSKRVVAYTLALAREMELPEEQMQQIARGALLHDIGKIGVPDAILHKEGELTEAEWEIIHKHPEWGKQILEGIPFLMEPAEMVLTHHERWDGTGYPMGLQGEMIPVGSRLFAVVDAFDAITSNRPYRKASSYEKARREIVAGRGSQFDPEVADLFLEFTEADWLRVLEEYAARDLPGGLRRGTGELDPRQVALADQVQALNRIVEAITSSLDVDEVLQKVVQETVRETTAVAAGVFLYSKEEDRLTFAAGAHLPARFVSGLDGMELGDFEERVILRESKAILCENLRDAKLMRALGVDEDQPTWQGYSMVPLPGSEGGLGLLVAFSEKTKPFNWNQHALFERVGRLLGQAIMNTRTHQRVRRQAITDALTGAYNRHYFDDFLSIETKRCSRYGRPMSMLLLDMDDFKGCNDRGGHQAGDQALREVVRILNMGLRTVDMVSRYGGEEFVVVLPETGEEGAMEAAERLRSLVEAHIFGCGNLTVSIGVASSEYSDGDKPNPDELFARADKALFEAKQAGRNRVALWRDEVER